MFVHLTKIFDLLFRCKRSCLKRQKFEQIQSSCTGEKWFAKLKSLDIILKVREHGFYKWKALFRKVE